MQRWSRWYLSIAAAAAAAAAAVDLVTLSRADLAARVVVIAVLSSAALAALAMVPVALSLSGMQTIWHRLRHKKAAWLGLASAAALVGFGLAIELIEPGRRRVTLLYWLLALGAGAAWAAASLLATRPSRLARLVAPALAAQVLVLDVIRSPGTYPELHDLSGLVFVALAAAATAPLRVRFSRWRRPWVPCIAALATSLSILAAADTAAPGWRTPLTEHAVHGPRSLRFAHRLVDLDRDGFSPILWGGDCADLDGERHPLAEDAPGQGDQNCNGVDPPEQPSESERGLTEAFGEPAMDRDRVQRVLLITIDTLRHDALNATNMPRLAAWSARGLRMERLYAAGASTLVSLPILFRGEPRAPSVVDTAAASGIATLAILSSGIDASATGFTEIQRAGPRSERLAELAMTALKEKRDEQLFLWLHFFEPHSPRVDDPTPPPAEPASWPRAYRQALRVTDLQVSRILEHLDATGELERSLVIVTADHGEAFGENGVVAHGRSGLDAVLRVPGFVVGAGQEPQNYQELVSHRDVAATILGGLGLADEAARAERFGRSWLRLRGNEHRALHDFVFVRSARYSSGKEADAPLGVLVAGAFKLVVDLQSRDLELYDLSRDPGELVDLAARERTLARELWGRLAIIADLDGFPADFVSPARL